MPSLRYQWFWRAGCWLLLAAVAVLSLMPSPPQPPVLVWDKAQHTVAYCVLGWSFLQAWEGRHALRWGLLLVAFGVLIECLQGFSAARMFDPADMLANTLGVAIGAVLAVATPMGRVFGIAERMLITK